MDEATEVVRRAPFGESPVVGERGASTRRRIVAAALQVFAEHGYHDARVELITEAAGCSRPAFYQYFASKQELFWHLAGRLARAMGDLTDGIGAVTPDEDGLQHLSGWLDALIDLCVEHDPVLSSYEAAVREQRPDGRGTRGIGNRVGAALVEAAGAPAQLDRPALTNTTVGVVLRSIYYWRLGLGQLDRPRFVRGLARTVHRVLHGAVDGVNVAEPSAPPPPDAPAWPQLPGTAAPAEGLRSRGKQTRQTLLSAGTAVLPRRGYHDTRVDDIVAEAGVSHGSFYRYFRNKDDLFHVLAEHAATAMVDLVASFPDDGGTDELRAWLSDWFRAYRANGGVISAWQEIGKDDPELAAFSLDVAAATFDRLTRIVHRRGFGDSTVDAVVLLAVIERIPYSVLALQHLGEEEALDASTFIVRRGLLAASA